MSEVFCVLYSRFNAAYVYEEREDCWQYTDLQNATRFATHGEAQHRKSRLEREGGPSPTVLKIHTPRTFFPKSEPFRASAGTRLQMFFPVASACEPGMLPSCPQAGDCGNRKEGR